MNIKKIIFIIISVISFLASAADGIYVNSPINTGPNAVYCNPSFLGRRDIPLYSFDLIRMNIGFSNDLISPAFTQYLFPHGMSLQNIISAELPSAIPDTITDEKKEVILHDIGSYMHFSLNDQKNFLSITPLMGMKLGYFAFAINNYAGTYLQIPNDMLRLSLYGNEFGRVYDFSSLYSETQLYSEAALGFGLGVDLENRGRLSFGLSAGYVAGHAMVKLSADSVYFQTDSTFLYSYADMSLYYALPIAAPDLNNMDNFEISPSYGGNPGNGFDINAGFTWNIDDEWLIEGSVEHAFSRIFWRTNAMHYSFRAASDSLNAIGIYNQYQLYGSDSLADSLYYDSLVLVDNEFTTILEPVINIGAGYTMRYLPLSLFARYSQGFKNTLMTSNVPKVSVGLNYTAWNWLMLEGMIAGGGREGMQVNLGIGFNFDTYTSDINVSQDRGMFNYEKGIKISINDNFHSSMLGTIKAVVVDSITGEPVIAKVLMKRIPSKGTDSLFTDTLGRFKKRVRKSDVFLTITADKYDTLRDNFYVMHNQHIEKVYKLNPSMGTLRVYAISGITKKPINSAQVIFTDGDTLLTDSTGMVEKRLEDGNFVVLVKSPGRDEVVFSVEIERGKEYSKTVEMFPTHGKIAMKIFNASTGEPVKSSVRVYTQDMTTLVDSFATDDSGIDTSKAIKKGFYTLRISPLVPKYIKQDKYAIEVKGGQISYVEVGLLKEKMVFVFNNILFDLNKATLKPESYAVCDSLAQIMKDNPSIKVEISGHTDSRGSASYNRKLSQSRAEAVRTYLISKHSISSKRIVAVGYGEDRLLVSPEKNEDDYQRNRRVEFKVLQGEN